MTLSSGARASSRNVAVKSESPSICRIGRSSIPLLAPSAVRIGTSA